MCKNEFHTLKEVKTYIQIKIGMELFTAKLCVTARTSLK